MVDGCAILLIVKFWFKLNFTFYCIVLS